jgi:LPS-assembly protein
VLFNADEVVYDDTFGLVTASGNVELAQGERIVLADRVTYNERTRVVTASGNVRLLEPSGDVVFAEYAELTDDLGQGFVDQIRVLMTDNARVAAAQGERTDDGRFLRLNRAVYSPCELCASDPTAPPLWQLKARRVVQDKQEQEVVYRDATLEMFGIPVLYTPYFSHPDPSVERQSGFLAPTFGLSSNIGTFLTVPYYWSISPDKDATFAPTFSTDDGLQLAGEWRQRFESGQILLNGSIVNADRKENSPTGTIVREDEWRGHLFGNGRFDLDDTWRTGFDVQHTTDESYLRRYNISTEDILTSRLFLEGFRSRNYAVVNAYRFQDLRPGVAEREPMVLPMAEASLLGEPGATFGGRWSLDAGIVGLLRDNEQDTRRFSTEAGWEREFVADAGFVTTVSGTVRADLYYTSDLERTDLPGSPNTDETRLRLFPQAQVTTRYPMVRQIGSVEQLLEPVVSLTLAPGVKDDPAIPNEDSTEVELLPTNLFRPNRFPGVDRLDPGSRITYGVNNALYGAGGGRAELFLGQSYRFGSEDNFPVGSGLEEDFSDYVASVRLSPNQYLDLRYNAQFDTDTLRPRVHDLTVSGGVPLLRLGGNYYYRDPLTEQAGVDKREYLTTFAASQLTPNWSVALSQSRDFEAAGDSLLTTAAVLTYADECFTFQLIGQRDYTTRADLESGDTIYFRLVFKNLGEFEAPLLSGGSGEQTTN